MDEIVRFIKKYGINVTLGFSSKDDTYKVMFRDLVNNTALDVRFDGEVFELDTDSAIRYSIEKAENEMVKLNMSVGELTND